MKELITKLTQAKLRETKGKIQQTDLRAWKADLHNLMFELIEQADFDVHEAQNALLIEVPHDEYGAIVVEAKFVIKPLDYDVSAAVDQYNEKKVAAAERKAERERKKAQDIKERE